MTGTGSSIEQGKFSSSPRFSRRQFAKMLAAGAYSGLAAAKGSPVASTAGASPFFQTRGIVIYPDELTFPWPERMRQSGLTTLGLHGIAQVQNGAVQTALGVDLAQYLQSEAGSALLTKCREYGLQTEYELHAMAALLPRALFNKAPAMFRQNKKGERTPDANLCVSSRQALAIVAENTVRLAKIFRPTTGRYFFWGDDGAPWCRCRKCRSLSDSDQALIVENNQIAALRRHLNPKAKLAHLCYQGTLAPPKRVKPAEGVFLEFAPYYRRYDIPLSKASDRKQKEHLEALDANLEIFRAEEAQTLEYWLDSSRFTNLLKLPREHMVKVPWDPAIFAADLDTYGCRGIRHVTTFAVYLDADYVRRYGDPPIEQYAAGLLNWRKL